MMNNKFKLLKSFIGRNEIPKYIFGLTSFGVEAHAKLKSSGVNITAYIDEFNDVKEFDGLPVISKLSDLPAGAIVLIGVVYGLPGFIKKKLDRAGILNVDFFLLAGYGGLGLTIPYWEGFHDSYLDNKAAYDSLYDCMADDISKNVLTKLLDFRLNYNLDAMDGFVMNIRGEYFEPFLHLDEHGETFCDVGGFDGETSLEFIKKCPNYEKIYYFEPEPEQMAVSKKNLLGHERIDYCQCAAYDRKCTLRFSPCGAASMVSNEGTGVVQADCIDSIVNSPVSFIKMDVEGSEAKAIAGAKTTIQKCHPKLAICVYHKGLDFIEIPRLVLSIRNDYDIYMRHYTEGISESVMFFIPTDKFSK